MTEQEIQELLAGEFTLDIPNFEKWNPSRKQKSVWVKLDCHWDQDIRVRPLGPSAQLLWVKLVCLMGVQSTSSVSATLIQLQSRVGLRTVECRSALVKLVKSGLIVLTKKERKKEKEREEEPVSPAWDRFTEKQKEILVTQFTGDVLLRLPDAVACWDTYDPYRQSTTPLIKTVQSYLKIARDNPTEPPKKRRTLMELAEAGEFTP